MPLIIMATIFTIVLVGDVLYFKTAFKRLAEVYNEREEVYEQLTATQEETLVIYKDLANKTMELNTALEHELATIKASKRYRGVE